jgi:uncharacterized protein YbjT (DUF2867 family)
MKLLRLVLKSLPWLLGAVVVALAGYVVLMSGMFHTPSSVHEFKVYQPGTGPVLVVGATQGTGLEIVRELVNRGQPVVASVRSTSRTAELDELGVEKVILDALDEAQVGAAISPGRYSAIISTVGVSVRDLPERRNALQSLIKGQVKMAPDKRPDYIGNRNLVDAARAAGIRRFLLVTVIGAGDSAKAVPLPARRGHDEVTPLKTQAEDYLRASGLDYTIIRPGGLGPRNLAPTSTAVLTEDAASFSYMSRTDLARMTVEALGDTSTIGRVYTAWDPSRLQLWNLFLD